MALSEMVSLSAQLHGQPGVFAVLLGSGVSTGAGLPTGWQVVKQLVTRAAVALDPAATPPSTDLEVEQWWAQHGTGELGYSSVLEALAPTSAGRQALLESFFEPNREELEPIGPSPAHKAVARLVARGTIRVIITTNFDRLMEQALQEEKIPHQVISRPEAVAGMKPLAHSRATVIKLHGDYMDLTTLNTPQELADYPMQWQVLLNQITDEYGLIIAGWSGDWDIALTHLLESCASRRYPLYWDSRSSRGTTAQRLLETRSGTVVDCASADELFTELEASVLALDRLLEPPLTTAISVARLKRYLYDPMHSIDLYDLVVRHLDDIRAAVGQAGAGPIGGVQEYSSLLADYLEASRPLLNLLAVGVRHDNEGRHNPLWEEVLDRLLALRRPPDGTFNDTVWKAQHYPALLAMYTMGAATLISGNEELFIRLGRDHFWKSPFDSSAKAACHLLRPDAVLPWDEVNQFERWSGTRWQQPPSHLVRADLATIVADLAPHVDTKQLLNDVEVRHALLVEKVPGGYGRGLTGEYRGDQHWGSETLDSALARFRLSSSSAGSAWPWWPVVGTDLELTLADLRRSVAW